MTRSGAEGAVWLEEVVDLIPANGSGRSGAPATMGRRRGRTEGAERWRVRAAGEPCGCGEAGRRGHEAAEA